MLNHDLLEEIKEYCKINNIPDVETLITKMLKRGFTIERFGDSSTEPEIKIVERIVEKEIFVDKIVTVTDDDRLAEIIEELENKFNDERADISEKHQTEKTSLTSKIIELEETIQKLSKNKPDIYDNPKGFFGSNLLDNK